VGDIDERGHGKPYAGGARCNFHVRPVRGALYGGLPSEARSPHSVQCDDTSAVLPGSLPLPNEGRGEGRGSDPAGVPRLVHAIARRIAVFLSVVAGSLRSEVCERTRERTRASEAMGCAGNGGVVCAAS